MDTKRHIYTYGSTTTFVGDYNSGKLGLPYVVVLRDKNYGLFYSSQLGGEPERLSVEAKASEAIIGISIVQ